ncbi:MAG: hypothetical protein MI892_26960 [Desulfobacterales bacterium]|nr:hypothetical protein [Desulfobacterales bacterium]
MNRTVTGYEGKLSTDPNRKTSNLLGVSKGLTGLISIKTVFRAAAAYKGGYRQGGIHGSTLRWAVRLSSILRKPSGTILPAGRQGSIRLLKS